MSKNRIDLSSIKFDDDSIVEDVDLATEEVIVDGERLTDERADAIAADVLAKLWARGLIRHARDD